MTQAIIYKTADGVAVIHPTVEALSLYGIEAIATKDVPADIPFKIVDIAEIPRDRTFRAAWDADFTAPDGVGAESNEFQEVAA